MIMMNSHKLSGNEDESANLGDTGSLIDTKPPFQLMQH